MRSIQESERKLDIHLDVSVSSTDGALALGVIRHRIQQFLSLGKRKLGFIFITICRVNSQNSLEMRGFEPSSHLHYSLKKTLERMYGPGSGRIRGRRLLL